MNEIVKVKIEPKNCTEYPIIIGNDILKDFFEYYNKYLSDGKILVVTNKTVKNLYGRHFHGYNTNFVVLDDGEKYKDIKSYEKIINKACEIKLERKDTIVALGGGVIGDLAGFAAASYLRGVNFVQVPTTLLAMVDSSVGGKTGFNNNFGKNLIGAFYQPKFVLTDISTLKTLPKVQLASGFGEVLKYCFIERNCNLTKEIELANFLIDNNANIDNLQEQLIIQMVKSCCEIKAAVVEQDEKENNLRRILNFGHTIGHAIEKALNYKRITHGEAIAIGMKIMFSYATTQKIIDEKYKENAWNLISKFESGNKHPKVKINSIREAMAHDKKIADSKINYVVPSGKLEVSITDKIDQDVMYNEIQKFFTN